MDTQKDIDKTDNLSSILARTVRINPFGENRAAERAYRRGERIASAIYLVTNHISDTEPSRASVRKEAAELLSDLLSLRDELRSGSGKVVRVLQRLLYIVSLTRLLGASGAISLQNMDVMVDALDELGQYVTTVQRSSMAESLVITREELADTSPQDSRTIKDRSNSTVKDVLKINDQRTVSYRNGDRKKTGEVRVRNIIEVVRTGGELGIKEISAHLPEYGEKTIQRELLSLVEAGQLRKIGLKRWSKYSLPA